MKFVSVLISILVMLAGGVAWAQAVIDVGPGTAYPTLEKAVAASSHGDTLKLRPARYVAQDLRIVHDLTLVGGADVVLTSANPVEKGLLVPRSGTVVTVREIVFQDAVSADKNGAGIRFEGATLIVDQCTFKNNENGILATGDPGGSLKVTRSYFEGNGHGDGYSHGIYQSSGQSFSISGSVFVGTREGHHLKILAQEVSIHNNRFDDAEGETSYVVDTSAGGIVFITDNEIIRRRSASQDKLFNYDTTRGGDLGEVILSGNKIITEKRGTRLIRNPENVKLTMRDNQFDEAKGGSFKDAATEHDEVKIARARDGGDILPEGTSASTASLTSLSPSQARAVGRMLKRRPDAIVSPQETLLRSPRFSPLREGEVAAFSVQAQGTGSAMVTFGQMFETGAVQPSTRLGARMGGEWVPAQVDRKTTHPDGSLRFGIVTVAVPDALLQESTDPEGRAGVLVRAERAALPLFPDQRTGQEMQEWTLEITGEGGADLDHVFHLRDLFDGRQPCWLDGALVKEWTTSANAGPLLTIRADKRLYADGTGRLRLSFDNHKTYSDVPRVLSYKVVLRDGDTILFEERISQHYRNSGWTTQIPLSARSGFRAVLDPTILVKSGAIPPYDLTQAVHAGSLPAVEGEVRPGETAPLTTYMPMTGGRSDIGPMTSWGATWAITQSEQAYRAMIRAANVGLTIPWHFEEDGSGLPVRADWRPLFWADSRGAKASSGADRIPDVLFSQGSGGWTPDLAHKPSLAYPAFLATGDLVYLRALRHEAAYAINGVWPELRGKGTLVTNELQLRSVAWSLRSIGNAAFILPDDDPFKDYMQTVLRENIGKLHDRYVRRGEMREAGETEGYFAWDSGHNTRSIAPWQNDFMVMVLALEAKRGSVEALDLTRWMTNYVAGRVLAAGEDLALSALYEHAVLSRTQKRLTAWQDVYGETQAVIRQEMPYVGGAEGGYGVLRGALGAIEDVTGDIRATEALRLLRDIPEAEKLYETDNQLGRAWNPQFTLDNGEGR